MAHAASIVSRGKKPDAAAVSAWLNEHIKWGTFHCPDVKTIERHLKNWEAISKSKRAVQLLDAATQRWGRENLLDWPTKLQEIVSRSAGDTTMLQFLVEQFFVLMIRTQEKDPIGVTELKKTITDFCWVRKYFRMCTQQYAPIFKNPDDGNNEVPTSGANAIQLCRHFLENPYEFYMKTESTEKDATWIQALPNEPLRTFMQHAKDMNALQYKSEIRSLCELTGERKHNLELFHKGSRVGARFFDPFDVAYRTWEAILTPRGTGQPPPDLDQTSGVTNPNTAEAQKTKIPKTEVDEFRILCEMKCKRELDARLVTFTSGGTSIEIKNTVTASRLYQNMSSKVPWMGYYDVKNAKLCKQYENENSWHREPLLDEADLERFIGAVEPLMEPGRDCVWLSCGRVDSNLPKARKILSKVGLKVTPFQLNYSRSQMENYGHTSRKRGLANCRSKEPIWLIFKGKRPKEMPSKRLYVDEGSPLFYEVIQRVPLLPPKFGTLVSKSVREESLKQMVGVPEEEDPAEIEKAKLAEDATEEECGTGGTGVNPVAAAASARKKRKLYRQATGEEQLWFPHDNSVDLLKELCWESGKPRWVIFGTPAAGAGVHGCFEMNASVVALCYDDHHRQHFNKACLERAVELMVAGASTVFKDSELHARSAELKLRKPPPVPEDPLGADGTNKKKPRKALERPHGGEPFLIGAGCYNIPF